MPIGRKSIYRLFAPELGLPAASRAAGTFDGTGVDRFAGPGGRSGGRGLTLITSVGTPTGSPSSFTVTPILQHSANGSSWSTAATFSAISTADAWQEAAEIVFGELYNRHIRARLVVAFVGGTSPAIACSAILLFAGRERG